MYEINHYFCKTTNQSNNNNNSNCSSSSSGIRLEVINSSYRCNLVACGQNRTTVAAFFFSRSALPRPAPTYP